MKHLFIIPLIIVTYDLLMAQSFTKGGNLGTSNFLNGATAWGDFDNDGDKDLIIIGTPGNATTKFYINNSDGTFTENLNHGFRNVGDGDLEWEDYNNDGRLDLLISGNDNTDGGFGTPVTRIYKNLGKGSFQELAGNFLNVYQGSVEWIDFNNDNKPDFLVSGRTNPQGFTNSIALYKNMGGDNFVAITTPFETFSQSDFDCADFDNDGDMDIAMAGYTGFNGVTKIYKNNGNETFSLHQQLTSAMRASLDWGDYNNDGNIDLVISGFSGTLQTLKVYKNVTGTFSEINEPEFVGGEQGSTNWIDYNNDGNLDIISSVIGDGAWSTRIYRNDGSDAFSLQVNTGLPVNDYSNISYVDLENDGDLDVFFPSTFDSTNAMFFYINGSSSANTSPNIPATNAEVISGSNATISWSASLDNVTPQSTLTYNIYVTHNSDTIVNPNSVKSGKRKILKGGNRQSKLNYVIANLKPGDYRWSAQAVDNSFNSSVFAATKSFHINYPPVITGVLNPLNTNEDTPVNILLNNLIINDPDNNFPGDFTVSISAGNNYTFSGNTLSPALNFNGILTVPIKVSDGSDQSATFNLSVLVVAVNDPPVVTGLKNPLSTNEEMPITISISNINVQDPDNTFPNDFSLAVSGGANYTFENNTITPARGFTGTLTVPITVSDGTSNSGSFSALINVEKIVGLIEQTFDEVAFYPNPASNFVNILLPEAPKRVLLFDALSRFLEIPVGSNFENKQIRLDVKSLQKGVYIVLISMGDRTIRQRLLID